jgi:hypothetical protein
MASGSQVCSGICADFVIAPTSRRMQPAVRSPLAPSKSRSTESNVPRKSSVPECLKMKYVPRTSATSPKTLMTNALMPARVAVSRRYQYEISRYDAAPTNAQPTMSSAKLLARTRTSIEKTKKFR